MFEVLDRQTRLTGNQKKILAAAIIGDALESFDCFLIAFGLGAYAWGIGGLVIRRPSSVSAAGS